MRHRLLPAVTGALRATHVRSWLRSQPGHLGPDPDRLVLALATVVVVLTAALVVIAALGLA
jgi:hypothetical protein